MWVKIVLIVNKKSRLRLITFWKAHLFEPSMIELPIMLKVPGYDFLDQFNKECVMDEVGESNIKFISDLKDMTFSHYMTQPKSMLCR